MIVWWFRTGVLRTEIVDGKAMIEEAIAPGEFTGVLEEARDHLGIEAEVGDLVFWFYNQDDGLNYFVAMQGTSTEY